MALIGLDIKLEQALIAVVGVIVGALLKHVLDRRLLRHRLKVDHEFHERRELRNLIGRYRARVVEAADLFSFRMRQIYGGEVRLPLAPANGYGRLDYYFHSTVLRFLVLLSLAMRFEREAFFIDNRYSEKGDLTFLWLSKGLRWMAADASLFDDLDYNKTNGKDHFFTDQLRDMCAAIVADDESEIGLSEFVELADWDSRPQRPVVRRPGGDPRRSDSRGIPRLMLDRGENHLKPALEFFDGLERDEGRFRWDRLVAFHLLTMAFLERFGYKAQRPKPHHFALVAKEFENPEVAHNLCELLDKLMVSGKVPVLRTSLLNELRRRGWVSPASAREAAPSGDRDRARGRGRANDSGSRHRPSTFLRNPRRTRSG
jgi:hypothetical protein